jgi:hypothetical protein
MPPPENLRLCNFEKIDQRSVLRTIRITHNALRREQFDKRKKQKSDYTCKNWLNISGSMSSLKNSG